MRRRAFLKVGCRAGAGLSLFPLIGCSSGKQSSVSTPKGVNGWEALIGKLENDIPMDMEKATLPGFSIVLIKGGQIFWRRGFGVRDNESKERVDNDTVFQAGSMSKPVFAYAVMKLCEKGVMELDTPLTRYTPERFLQGDPRLDLITARHVLSHSSGFQNWRSEKSPLKIHFTPGEQFRYSGEGYFYLQSVVTHLKGKVNTEDCTTYEGDLKVCATDIEDFMKANVLTPFGMTSSGYTWNDRIRPHLARGHDQAGIPLSQKTPKASSVARYASSGALLTTPSDYAKFLIEVFDPKPTDSFRLNEHSLKEMIRPQVRVNDSTSWALGWAFYNEAGPFIGHGGDNKGFHSFAVVSVKDKSGYVMMTNGDGGVAVLKNVMGRLNEFLGDAA